MYRKTFLVACLCLPLLAGVGCKSNLEKVAKSTNFRLEKAEEADKELAERVGRVETQMGEVKEEVGSLTSKVGKLETTVTDGFGRIEQAMQEARQQQDSTSTSPPGSGSDLNLRGGYSLDNIVRDTAAVAEAEDEMRKRHQAERAELEQYRSSVQGRVQSIRDVLGISDLARQVAALEKAIERQFEEQTELSDIIIAKLDEIEAHSFSFRKDSLESLEDIGFNQEQSQKAFEWYLKSKEAAKIEEIRLIWKSQGYDVEQVEDRPTQSFVRELYESPIPGGKIKTWIHEATKKVFVRYRRIL